MSVQDASGIFAAASMALSDVLKSTVPLNILGFHEQAAAYDRTIRRASSERPIFRSAGEAWDWIKSNSRKPNHEKVRVYRGEAYGRHLAEVKIDGVLYVLHATKGWKKGVHR